MTVDGGWIVAGVLLVGSGLALCRRPGVRIPGGLFAVAGVLLLVADVATEVEAARVGVVAMVVLTAAVATYPRPTKDLATALALGAAVVGAPALAWYLDDGSGLRAGDLAWVAFVCSAVGLSHLWWRLETTYAGERGPLLWVLSAVGIALFAIGVAALGGMPVVVAWVLHATLGLVGVAAVIGVERAATLDGRWLASRAAAVLFTLACLFAAATLVFTLVESGTGSPPGILAMAVAAVACGVLWNPLLRVVQRVSDGVLFGFRPDPLAAAARMAVTIGHDPTGAVRAIQESLALPYVALALADEDRIEVGTPTDHRRVLPVDVDGQHVGDLVVGIRPGDLDLTRDDERVLTLSLPMLVQTIKLHAQAESLQRAREAGAAAREEERRRLRRDLHDGLGPRLTGIAFTADAARLAAADDASAPMLDRIRQEVETAIQEIRELAHGLRPPALDELGLVGAIKVQTETLSGLAIEVQADALPGLPAAAEVAAYRIVMEALTNVARHSGAGRATVSLGIEGQHLTVGVADDGHGEDDWVPGVGVTSMKERAAELGGSIAYDITRVGTTVRAKLPIGEG
jgi:two-component system NarL family sensor kinase